jgi:hypothetical protein
MSDHFGHATKPKDVVLVDLGPREIGDNFRTRCVEVDFLVGGGDAIGKSGECVAFSSISLYALTLVSF